MLFTPITLKNLKLKNRIVMSPMCIREAKDGFVSDKHIIHYGARAMGQVGFIIVEATAIEPRGQIFKEDLGIWNDEHKEGLKKLVDTIHSCDSKIGIQIAHAGRKSTATDSPISASDVVFDQRFNTPKSLTLDEIENIIKLFIEAIKRAIDVGFDAIEIHAAHGYLINQFLSPITNKRTDQYGGSLENRFRILHQIIKRTRSFYNGVLMLRISATDYIEGGMEVEDYISILKHYDIDFVDVSTGGLIDNVTVALVQGYQVKYSELIKKGTNKKTGAVGLIDTPKFANDILKNNKADLIFLGRPLLRDPNWVLNAAKYLGEHPTVFDEIFWIHRSFM